MLCLRLRLCASQEGINVSAVPTASRIFFQIFVRTLPTMSLANSVDGANSKTIGVTDVNSETVEFANSFLGT